MAKRPDIELRKEPATEAGTQITDAVLLAAAAVLETHGPGELTTNLVAKRAGVSVGSLYQYFPNKDSILAQLARRIERLTQEKLIAVFEESVGKPLRDTAASVVDTLLGELGSVKMRRALRLHLPVEWTMETAEGVDQTIRGRLAREFAARDDVRGGDYLLMAWVVGHAIEHVIEQAVLAAPELLESGRFRDELIELAVRYLRA